MRKGSNTTNNVLEPDKELLRRNLLISVCIILLW